MRSRLAAWTRNSSGRWDPWPSVAQKPPRRSPHAANEFDDTAGDTNAAATAVAAAAAAAETAAEAERKMAYSTLHYAGEMLANFSRSVLPLRVRWQTPAASRADTEGAKSCRTAATAAPAYHAETTTVVPLTAATTAEMIIQTSPSTTSAVTALTMTSTNSSATAAGTMTSRNAATAPSAVYTAESRQRLPASRAAAATHNSLHK